MPQLSYFDSHCHLTAPDFDDDREEVLARARSAGVGHLLVIGSGYGADGNGKAVRFAASQTDVYSAVGVHPHEASLWNDEIRGQIVELAGHARVVAIGEIGLDYHYNHSIRDIQLTAFESQCLLALEVGKPIVIHCREAFPDLLKVIQSTGVGKRVGGVLHCFTGTTEEALACIDSGLFVSASGIVTFKRAADLRATFQDLPIERILIETDSPYLAPPPHRGKRNEPANVVRVAEAIAEVKGLTIEDVARITTVNAQGLFLPSAALPAEIAYTIRKSVYLNITNQCTLACVFCPKFRDWMVKGHFLQLPVEPAVDVMMTALDAQKWEEKDEVVFCGYGEPTNRLPELLEVARQLRARGARRIRINTDGLGNLVHGRDIVPELAGIVDAFSISMNADSAEKYRKYCPNPYGADAYGHVKAFIKRAAELCPDVTASVVAMPNLDLDACGRLAVELGAKFRVRPLNEVG